MGDRTEIDEIRRRIDLVSVVEKYVTLKRSGRGLVGLCPFHPEKTPSFHVNADLGLWKCYGQCSEGGDVFSFVQKIESLSFAETLEKLAIEANVTLAPFKTQGSGVSASTVGSSGQRDRIYKANVEALRYFRSNLHVSKPARSYLAGRGITAETVENFRLGFAPESWDGLTNCLRQACVSLEDAEAAGLVGKAARGYYDRLRGRVIFPIFDVQERAIAFGGRLIGTASSDSPKYWNSPETPVFSKSRTLYGLALARKAIAEHHFAVIVEGYTDVVAAHQAGFPNVVATLGTALTEEHVKVLARLAPAVRLAFDADSAGLKAAYRAAAIFETHDVEVRVVELPHSEDPDSLLRAGRIQEFKHALDTAKPLIEYRLSRLIETEHVSPGKGEAGLFKKAIPIIAAIPSAIEREIYIKQLAPYHPQFANGAAYAEEQIRREVSGSDAARVNSNAVWNGSQRSSREMPAPPQTACDRAEQQLLRALTMSEPIVTEVVLAGLRPDEFISRYAQTLAACLYAEYAQSDEPDMARVLAAVKVVDPPAAEKFTDLLMSEADVPLNAETLKEGIHYLREQRKRQRWNALRREVAQGTADITIQQEYFRLSHEIKGSSITSQGGRQL